MAAGEVLQLTHPCGPCPCLCPPPAGQACHRQRLSRHLHAGRALHSAARQLQSGGRRQDGSSMQPACPGQQQVPMGSQQPVKRAAAPHADMCRICTLLFRLGGHCQAATSRHSANAACADTTMTWRSSLHVLQPHEHSQTEQEGSLAPSNRSPKGDSRGSAKKSPKSAIVWASGQTLQAAGSTAVLRDLTSSGPLCVILNAHGNRLMGSSVVHACMGCPSTSRVQVMQAGGERSAPCSVQVHAQAEGCRQQACGPGSRHGAGSLRPGRQLWCSDGQLAVLTRTRCASRAACSSRAAAHQMEAS